MFTFDLTLCRGENTFVTPQRDYRLTANSERNKGLERSQSAPHLRGGGTLGRVAENGSGEAEGGGLQLSMMFSSGFQVVLEVKSLMW